MQRALILAGCLFLVSSPALADRFYTWVDAQGHLHSTKIQESKNPIDQRAEAVKKEKQAAERSRQAEPPKPGNQAQQARSGGTPAEAKKGATGSAEATVPAVPSSSPQPSPSPKSGSSVVAVPAPGTSSSQPLLSRPALSKTSAPESASKSAPTSARGTSAPKKPAEQKSASDQSASQYNLKNYPDGENLARHGYVRDPNHRPFFDWVDASGVHHVTQYQPPPDTQAEKEIAGKQGTAARAQQAARLYTQARVLRPGMAKGLPKGANPAAIKFLGLDKTPSLFTSFASRCCSRLARADDAKLPQDRTIEVKVGQDASVHKFSSGKSHYRWVSLPAGTAPYDLNIRSFIHQGVFIPSVVFLTSDFKITRVMTDMVLDYVPENWYRYGYLHARIQVHPEKGERWLLIYTRRQDVKDETVVDEGGHRLSIPHKATGSIALEKLRPGSTETASLW